jgi:hypothetical protein
MPANVDTRDNERGSWGYVAGVSGTVVIAAGRRVLGIAAYSSAGGTLTINGGDSRIGLIRLNQVSQNPPRCPPFQTQ